MFDVKLAGDKLVCTLVRQPAGHKLIKPSPMECLVTLELGVKPSKPAAKVLTTVFPKTFNAHVAKKSGKFLDHIDKTIIAIGSAIEKDGLDSVKASAFLTKEESDLQKLWANWSKKLAPRLADEALQAVEKSKRDSLGEVTAKQAKAVGRAVALPMLSLTAASASLAAGNFYGFSSAVIKGVTSLMKIQSEMDAAMNEFRVTKAATQKDVDSLNKAISVIQKRIQLLEKQRSKAELKIMALNSQQRTVASGLAAQKGDSKDLAKARKLIEQSQTSAKAALANLPPSDQLMPQFKRMAGESYQMQQALGAMDSPGSKSLKNLRDVLDGTKEILSIISKSK